MKPRKRDRHGYNGYISTDLVKYFLLRQWCKRNGVSMRSVVGDAINAKLDEIEQKEGKR